jgi:hypothetical protein
MDVTKPQDYVLRNNKGSPGFSEGEREVRSQLAFLGYNAGGCLRVDQMDSDQILCCIL